MTPVPTQRAKRLAMLLVLGLAAFCPSCAQRNLFVDDDPAAHKKKYWDDESVRESHAVREQSKGAGFGMANGPGAQ